MAKQLVLLVLLAAIFCLATTATAAKPRRTALKADGTSKIKHIVVAMLENRAFDHMLGWMGQWGVELDGLTGSESNTIHRTDGTTFEAKVNGNCPYIHPFDPLHNVYNTTMQTMNSLDWKNPAPMSGFAQTHYLAGFPEPETVMHGFTPDRVPAISTLAKEFAVFDKYFCSVPGPTFPNRLYLHSGTSHGMTVTSNLTLWIPGAPQTSVYDVIEANNMTWRSYFEDLPDLLIMQHQRTFDAFNKLRWFEDFKKDCDNGDLPDYTWLSPQFYASFGKQARDQHPDHDVVLGEQYIKEVYEAIRNSPVWNETLLIITYDEHGGYYDHVSPPANNIPNPDGIIGGQGTANEFNFTRMGVRVPFIAISPYINKGVVSWPKEAPAKQYEHSSVYATMKRLYGLPQELSKRTEWAAPFDFLLDELSVPRTDCPTTIPTPAVAVTPSMISQVLAEATRPVNDLQEELWAVLTSTIHDIELGKNAHEPIVALKNCASAADRKLYAQRLVEVKARFADILPSRTKGRFAGALKATSLRARMAASPLLHERMKAARFPTQGQMAEVTRQIMEILVPRRK